LYDFVADDGCAGWGRALLEVKSFPRVFGVPMHNFSVPSVLKLWIDQIARVNKTFSYATGKPEGLLKGKKATILISSGGRYDQGTAMASWMVCSAASPRPWTRKPPSPFTLCGVKPIWATTGMPACVSVAI